MISCTQRIITEWKIHHKEDERHTELNEIKSPEGTRREGPPFPINSRTKYQESISKISPERRKGEEQRGKERGDQQGEGAHLVPWASRTRLCWPPLLSYPPSLPLKTRIPLSAEIKLEGP
jgi:hypothetical protein